MKIIVPRGDWRSDSLVVHLTRAIDVFAQTIVEVALAAAFFHFRLVVEFDFRHEQASKATRIVVQTTFILADLHRQVRFGHAVATRTSQRRGVLRSEAGRRRRGDWRWRWGSLHRCRSRYRFRDGLR